MNSKSPFYHKSSAELFALGDYTGAAMASCAEANKNCWQGYAALGLVGKYDQALAQLQRFKDREAQFYMGVINWLNGSDADALSLLRTIDLEHAHRLTKLIEKPRISVLGFVPFGWTKDYLQDSKFSISMIGNSSGEMPIAPYSDIHKYYSPSAPPDFLFAQMIEWHDICQNIQEAPFPIFGASADYDAQIQTVYPWLSVFDELIAPTTSEWEDLNKLTGLPVTTYPRLYGSAHPQAEISIGERANDVFLSGTTLQPYFPEKTKLFHELLDTEGINFKYVIGFSSEYFEHLKNTKATFSFVRRPYGIPTRAIEALCMGCVAITQEHSALELFVGEEEGLLSYANEKDLIGKFKNVASDWPKYAPRAAKGAKVLNQYFNLTSVYSQYLRFLTFLAAKPRAERRQVDRKSLVQKDYFFIMGRKDSPELRSIRRMNNLSFAEDGINGNGGAECIINSARDLVFEYARANYKPAQKEFSSLESNEQNLDLIMAIYNSGIARFPERLVLHFNRIRVALHCGRPDMVDQALEHTLKVISYAPENWQVRPHDDVFPVDFYRLFFNYRKYLDLATKCLIEKQERGIELAQIIFAALYSYLGHYQKPIQNFEKAISYDADFPYYKLQLAQSLVKNVLDGYGKDGDLERAGELLEDLADTNLFLPASELLERLHKQSLYQAKRYEQISKRLARFKASGSIGEKEPWAYVNLQPAGTLVI